MVSLGCAQCPRGVTGRKIAPRGAQPEGWVGKPAPVRRLAAWAKPAWGAGLDDVGTGRAICILHAVKTGNQ